jgi:hypothetical protein
MTNIASIERLKGRWEKVFMLCVSAWGVVRIFIQRPRVVMFGNDTIGRHQYDLRMVRIYEWLAVKRIPYSHLVHAAPHGRVVRHWLQRRGPTVYLESIMALSPAVLSWLFSVSRTRQVWGIDDYRYWPAIVSAARSAGCTSVLFQHGRFTRHQAGIAFPEDGSASAVLPDSYMVWNAYWRKRLLALSPPCAAHPERVHIGGKASRDAVPVHRDHTASGGLLRVMLVHEPAAPSKEVRAFIERLSRLDGVALIYKVRKDQDGVAQLRQHGLTDQVHAPRWQVTSELVPADVALASYSTLLYEMVQAGIPAGVIAFSSMQADDLVAEGLAAPIDPSASDLLEELIRAAHIPSGELERRAEVLEVPISIEHTLDSLITVF